MSSDNRQPKFGGKRIDSVLQALSILLLIIILVGVVSFILKLALSNGIEQYAAELNEFGSVREIISVKKTEEKTDYTILIRRGGVVRLEDVGHDGSLDAVLMPTGKGWIKDESPVSKTDQERLGEVLKLLKKQESME